LVSFPINFVKLKKTYDNSRNFRDGGVYIRAEVFSFFPFRGEKRAKVI
jgi:hypothetical protein